MKRGEENLQEGPGMSPGPGVCGKLENKGAGVSGEQEASERVQNLLSHAGTSGLYPIGCYKLQQGFKLESDICFLEIRES